MEKVIDGNLVALEIKNTTKRLKVNEFMALVGYTTKNLEEMCVSSWNFAKDK